jgi:hypothetical protein
LKTNNNNNNNNNNSSPFDVTSGSARMAKPKGYDIVVIWTSNVNSPL